ncbi:hypothetical protein ANME2D_00334 [Candidatus Methanoperedens nitroreducens]|uniref:Uncharacterized protein n=1 Tax=Candidatus Methanoperedens nitratireducens TaxID=1392998 RepID=A0A062V9P1_9EURY|nr:hypothetical protein [Candidatus Methanoperedens nitroreducens]KCZ73268.1 hypothetical protein ANME2D_00334 [Candidatus Methanoperedens nitroreducens]MDJ1422784.1 hypothetical protein [Candidatus Methanoperedens sp.]
MREILADIERNRIRIVIRYDEDEMVVRLKLNEARELSEKLNELLLDFEERKKIRID